MLEKTDRLLKKFNVASVQPPRRDQFPSRHRDNQAEVDPLILEERRREREGPRRGMEDDPRRREDDLRMREDDGGRYSSPARDQPRRDDYSRGRRRSVSPDNRRGKSLKTDEEVQGWKSIYFQYVVERSFYLSVIPCLRLLSALETDLGSLGPEVNKMMSKALNYEQDEDGGSRELLNDADSVSVMELVKEKMKGLIDTG